MRIELDSGTPAELALPDGEPTRGVAMVPDIMGLRPLFHDLCARLAAEHGWAVCAIEPFAGRDDLDLQERLERGVGELHDERVLGDLVAAADRLGTDRVAALGFCMGGMYAFKAAGWPPDGERSRFDRSVAFYGMIRPPDHWRGPGHRDPLEYLSSRGSAPVLAIIGGKDTFTPDDDVDALRAVGPQVRVVRYPDAEHGFVHDPSRPAHRADDAADAWRRVAEFLA